MRQLESRQVTGRSGKSYTMNVYPADMRFNDFIGGVFFILADKKKAGAEARAISIGESDNVDLWLRQNDAVARFREEGFTRIGFIKNGSREVRQLIVDDLEQMLSP